MQTKKLLPIGIVLSLLATLGIWVNNRWPAWFYNPEEPAFETFRSPSCIMLTLGEKPNSRIITWQYDSIPTEGTVELINHADTTYIQAFGERITTKGGVSIYYKAVLSGLKMGVHYQYRILHPSVGSNTYSFTMPNEENHLTFVYIGDIQDTIGGIFGESLKKIKKAVPNPNFYLLGGDVIERPQQRYWKKFFADFDSIAGNIPILAIPGNHEYLKGISNKMEKRFSLVFPYFEHAGNESSHLFTFEQQNTRFFLLDSNADIWKLPAQRKWLENALKNTTSKWNIVVLHHPIHSIRHKGNNLMVKWMFNPPIEKYQVDLVLQGHEHGYARKGHGNKQPVYIISHCSPKQYKHTSVDGMDYYEKTPQYQKISIGKDSIFIQSFDLDGKEKDRIVIKK